MINYLFNPVTEHDYGRGNLNTPITFVWYGDLSSPECHALSVVFDRLLDTFKEHVRVLFRHFPDPEGHPISMELALMAEAVARQGLFWPFYHACQQAQVMAYATTPLNIAEYHPLADELALDLGRLARDLTDPTVLERVLRDYESGLWSGVLSAPAVFINTIGYEGVMTYEALARISIRILRG